MNAEEKLLTTVGLLLFGLLTCLPALLAWAGHAAGTKQKRRRETS
jgi:hypothetical protein